MDNSKKSDNSTPNKNYAIGNERIISTLIEKVSKTYTIMIVDDVEINLFILSELLESVDLKLNLIKCSSGEEAVEKFIECKPDLLILDIYMPSMNGFETAKILRDYEQKKQLSKTPIIALTADSFSENSDNDFENLFNDFLLKPINIINLEECLIRYL